MSSSQIHGPDFRLVFDATHATLHERGRAAPLRALPLGDTDLAAGLRAIGAEVAAARGRLVVELPRSEIWQGALDPGGATRLGRWRASRRMAASALGLAPWALGIGIGAAETDGRRSVAAARRTTLSETRAYLEAAGIEVAAFEVPDAAGPPIGLPERPAFGPRHALAAGGAIAAAASVALLLGTGGPAPVAEAPALPAVETVAADPPAVPTAQSAALVSVTAPPHRPVPPPDPAPDRSRIAVPATPSAKPVVAEVVPPAPPPAPVIKAGRDRPGLATTVGARDTAAAAGPRPRPATAVTEAPVVLAALPSANAGLRPLRRPTAAALPEPTPVPVKEAASPATPPPQDVTSAPRDAGPRPVPRPGRTAASPPAELSSAITDAVESAAAAPPPTSLRPEPRRLAARPKPPAPVVFKPQQPTITRTPTTAAPVRTVAVAAQPAVTQPRAVQVKAPAPAPQPVAIRSPGRERVGLNRRQVSLVGIFGDASDRYALVRVPGGKVYRVRPGDKVDGSQVAAIDRTSVRLAGRGNNVVLTLP